MNPIKTKCKSVKVIRDITMTNGFILVEGTVCMIHSIGESETGKIILLIKGLSSHTRYYLVCPEFVEFLG